MNQHDLDLLADYAGGALDGTAEGAEVGRRIREDLAWAAAYTQLNAAVVRAGRSLSALEPAAEPMPDGVWSRLEAAFAAESGAPSPDSGAPTYELGTREGRLHPPSVTRPPARPRRRRRSLAIAGATLAVLGVFVFGFQALRDTNRSYDNTSTGSSADKAPAAALAMPNVIVEVSGRDYTSATLTSASDFGEVANASRGPQFASPAQKTLSETQVAQVPAPLVRLTEPSALRACLDAVVAAVPGQVEGVDYAKYAGSPALVVVVTSADGSHKVAVAGPECGTGDAHLLAQATAG